MTVAANQTRIVASALLRGLSLADRHLVVREGPDEGRRFPLGADQTIGRGRGADLRLSDPSASRVHFRLTHVDGCLVLADLRSKNGLRVNGRPLRAAEPLEIGDEVAIGSTRLTLEPGLLDATKPGATAEAAAIHPARRASGSTRITLALLIAAGTLIAAAALLLGLP